MGGRRAVVYITFSRGDNFECEIHRFPMGIAIPRVYAIDVTYCFWFIAWLRTMNVIRMCPNDVVR